MLVPAVQQWGVSATMFSTRRTNPTDAVSIPVKSLAWMLLLRPGTLSVTIISSPDSIRLATT